MTLRFWPLAPGFGLLNVSFGDNVSFTGFGDSALNCGMHPKSLKDSAAT